MRKLKLFFALAIWFTAISVFADELFRAPLIQIDVARFANKNGGGENRLP